MTHPQDMLENIFNVALGEVDGTSLSSSTHTITLPSFAFIPRNLFLWTDIETEVESLAAMTSQLKEQDLELYNDYKIYIRAAGRTIEDANTEQKIQSKQDILFEAMSKLLGELKYDTRPKSDAMFLYENQAIMVGELKHPTKFNPPVNLANVQYNSNTFRSNASDYDGKTQRAISQICGYMCVYQTKYGFLQTQHQWWFLRRNCIDGEYSISITNARNAHPFIPDADCPSPVLLLGRLLQKCKVEGGLELSQEEMNGFVLIDSTTGKEFEGEARSRKIEQIKKERRIMNPEADKEIHSRSASTLNMRLYHEDCVPISWVCSKKMTLGHGRTGVVYLLKVDGFEIVVKLADVSKEPHLLQEMEKECELYEYMKELQGNCVPQLIFPKPMWYWPGVFICIAMFYVGEKLPKRAFSNEEVDNAIQDLKNIHCCGIMHRDIERRNLAWNSEKQKIMFLDFGNSDMDTTEAYQEREIEELKGILNHV